jgi:hypothetical protein
MGEIMSFNQFTALYLDYFNNFLTVEAFAAHHNLSLATANFIVDTGRAIAYYEFSSAN